MGVNGEKDYCDLSYIPGREDGVIFVDTSAIGFIGSCDKRKAVGRGGVEKMEAVRARACLNLFRNRGGFVTTEGVLGEIGATVAYYVSMRSGIKRAISNNRRTRRENRRSGIRSSPSSLREVLRDNKYYLKTHRSLSRFLSSETEGNFPEVSSGMFPTFYKEIDKVLTERDFLYPYDSLCGLLEEQAGRDFPEEWDSEFSSICEIWLSVCGNDPLSKLSSVDKGLVVAAIYGGDGCGLFSADGSMISAYHRAVRDFALSDCFVCDAVNRRVDWLK